MALPRIKVGDTIRAQHLQQICSEIEQNRIRPGKGVRIVVTSAGTTVSADDSERRAGGTYNPADDPQAIARQPFYVTTGYPADPTFPVLRIQGESYVSSIETGELFSITGDPGLGAILGSAQDNADDPGQFPLPQIGDSIWLEATVSGYAITSVSVWIGHAGDAGLWENYPDPIEVTTGEGEFPVVVKSRCLIAHVVDGSDPRHGDVYVVGSGETIEYRKVLQQLRTNLGVQVLMMRGIPAPVFVPWHGPFIIP